MIGITKEEYKEKSDLFVEVDKAGKKDLDRYIDKIFNDFENRTCGNCKYAISNIIKNELLCNLNVSENHNSKWKSLVKNDFNCNKWESKC